MNKRRINQKGTSQKKERMINMKIFDIATLASFIGITSFFEKVFYDIMRYRFYIASEKMLKIREKLEDKKDVSIN